MKSLNSKLSRLNLRDEIIPPAHSRPQFSARTPQQHLAGLLVAHGEHSPASIGRKSTCHATGGGSALDKLGRLGDGVGPIADMQRKKVIMVDF